MSDFYKGRIINVRDYDCSTSDCIPIYRPAEISGFPETDDLVYVHFLDKKFVKGKRDPIAQAVLKSKCVFD